MIRKSKPAKAQMQEEKKKRSSEKIDKPIINRSPRKVEVKGIFYVFFFRGMEDMILVFIVYIWYLIYTLILLYILLFI